MARWSRFEMIGFIRPELKFDDVDSLVGQMHTDKARRQRIAGSSNKKEIRKPGQ